MLQPQPQCKLGARLFSDNLSSCSFIAGYDKGTRETSGLFGACLVRCLGETSIFGTNIKVIFLNARSLSKAYAIVE